MILLAAAAALNISQHQPACILVPKTTGTGMPLEMHSLRVLCNAYTPIMYCQSSAVYTLCCRMQLSLPPSDAVL